MNGRKLKLGDIGSMAVGVAAILVLAGCSNASQMASSPQSIAPSTPSVTPPLTKSAAQVASAVASTKKRLESTISRYNANSCDVMIERGPTGMDKASCVADKSAIASLSSAMAMTLESQQPWSSEVDDLASRTVSRLKSVAAAADGKLSANMFHDSVLLLGQDLAAWAPFGA